MWSERHKYPPRPVVITSAAAIDSSNKCLEGHRTCACLMGCWWIWHIEWRFCVDRRVVVLKSYCFLQRFGLWNWYIYSKPIYCKFPTAPHLHNSCMSTWGKESVDLQVYWRSSQPSYCARWLTGRLKELLRIRLIRARLLLSTVYRQDAIPLKMSALWVCSPRLWDH